MSFSTFLVSVHQGLHGARSSGRRSLGLLRHDPAIAIYPLIALVIVLFTLPTINGIIFGIANTVAHESLFSADPHSARLILGIIAGILSFTYISVITSYFTCATSAAVLAKLSGQPAPPLSGPRAVRRHFGKITIFGLCSAFFIPLGIWAQRKKLPRGIVGVAGSSFSLNMGALAPTIITKHLGVSDTISTSIDTLGKAWREQLVFKIVSYGLLILLGAIGFLPKLVEHYWFDGHTARFIGWFASAVLWTAFFVTTKVLIAVYTATLYHRVTTAAESK